MGACITNTRGCEQPVSGDVKTEAQVEGGRTRTILVIAEMDCPTEETLIRNKLAGMPGIAALEFNLLERTLILIHAPEALEPIVAAIRALGMETVVQGGASGGKSSAKASQPTKWWPLALSGLAATPAQALRWVDDSLELVETALAVTTILVDGLPTYKKGWVGG